MTMLIIGLITGYAVGMILTCLLLMALTYIQDKSPHIQSYEDHLASLPVEFVQNNRNPHDS